MPRSASSHSEITTKQRPAVIYARVSSRDQEREGFSIPAQQELLRAYAGANGYAIAQEFISTLRRRKPPGGPGSAK
jgi:predicted site-specific integrase-resolvase